MALDDNCFQVVKPHMNERKRPDMLTGHPLKNPMNVYNHKKQTKDHHVLKCSSDSKSLELAIYLRNEFDFWNVHGSMNTSGLLQSK